MLVAIDFTFFVMLTVVLHLLILPYILLILLP